MKCMNVLGGMLLLLLAVSRQALAVEYMEKKGLFEMEIPEGWHWQEFPGQVVISYPDGQTLAIDVEFAPTPKMSRAQIKKALNDGNNKMVNAGVEAHHGSFLDEKEIRLGGLYAIQLDFKTGSLHPVTVTYISCFTGKYAITATYAAGDDNTRLMLDDVMATFKFK